jgi:hypothetical protein
MATMQCTVFVAQVEQKTPHPDQPIKKFVTLHTMFDWSKNEVDPSDFAPVGPLVIAVPAECTEQFAPGQKFKITIEPL